MRSGSLPDGVVYFLPPKEFGRSSGELDLRALVQALWSSRSLIAGVTLLFTLVGVAYALTAQKWYRAEVVVVPVESDPTSQLMSQFGSLANLVGVNVGGPTDAEPLAVLQSREFARDFIERRHLLPILFARRWDATHSRWLGPREKWPDVRDGVRFFDKRVRRIVQDRKSGLIEVWMDWKDPVLAAEWADAYLSDANERLRDRSIKQSQANVDYLRSQMADMNLVSLQQPVGRLLEIELQKLMLAHSSAQFAFRVVDAAEIPKRPTRPWKKLIIAGAFFLGAFLACLFVTVRQALRQDRATAQD